MNKKHYQSILHANVNLTLIEAIVIQINGETMINVDLSVTNVMSLKKIMLGIILNIIVKMENI